MLVIAVLSRTVTCGFVVGEYATATHRGPFAVYLACRPMSCGNLFPIVTVGVLSARTTNRLLCSLSLDGRLQGLGGGTCSTVPARVKLNILAAQVYPLSWFFCCVNDE